MKFLEEGIYLLINLKYFLDLIVCENFMTFNINLLCEVVCNSRKYKKM